MREALPMTLVPVLATDVSSMRPSMLLCCQIAAVSDAALRAALAKSEPSRDLNAHAVDHVASAVCRASRMTLLPRSGPVCGACVADCCKLWCCAGTSSSSLRPPAVCRLGSCEQEACSAASQCWCMNEGCGSCDQEPCVDASIPGGLPLGRSTNCVGLRDCEGLQLTAQLVRMVMDLRTGGLSGLEQSHRSSGARDRSTAGVPKSCQLLLGSGRVKKDAEE